MQRTREGRAAPASRRSAPPPAAPARGGRRSSGTLRVPLVLAAATGAAAAASFPPVGAWPLAVAALAGLLLLVRGGSARRGALLGLAHGAVFFALLLGWLRVIGVDAWLLVVALEAAFFAPLGAALAVVSRRRGWVPVSAALVVAEELARGRLPLGGFPWGKLAFSQTASPLTPYAALGGAPLVTFATALAAAALAAALLALRAGRPRAGAGALAGALAVPALAALVPLPTAAAGTATVALVQGDVPGAGMDAMGERRRVLENHAGATEALAASVRSGQVPAPDAVVWPENSTDIDPFDDPSAYARIDAAVREIGVPTLVGAVVAGPDADHRQNVGIVWDPATGAGERYVKRHPVPFGEYIPLRSLLAPRIERLRQIPLDFAAGDRAGVLDVGPVRVGDVICFEVAYDGVVRDAVRGGGRVLVVQTNNATYARTGQPEQQLAMSRLRAVEHGRAVLVAATNGISAVIAPDGTVVERAELSTRAALVHRVPLRNELSVADRLGAAPEWALAGLGLVGLLAPPRTGRTGRPSSRASAHHPSTRTGPRPA